MVNLDHARIVRLTLVAGATAAGLGLAGCSLSSPTYGTDKTANQQLLEDVTGMIALGGNKEPKIDYKPRPELVKPETTAVLPPPQDDVTTASNPQWPESNEERLARVRAEADENRDSPFYRPNVVNDAERNTAVTYDDPVLANMSSRERHEEIKRRRIAARSGGSSGRQYLSEPPVEYRVPAETAPVGELGDPEWKKDRRARRDAGGGKSLF